MKRILYDETDRMLMKDLSIRQGHVLSKLSRLIGANALAAYV